MSGSTDVTNSLMQKMSDFCRTYFLPQQFGRHTLTLNPKTLNPKILKRRSLLAALNPRSCSKVLELAAFAGFAEVAPSAHHKANYW